MGTSLLNMFVYSRISVPIRLQLLWQLPDRLKRGHASGIVHGYITAANIRISGSGEVPRWYLTGWASTSISQQEEGR
jgi:serine/threonine protein kinase